MKEKTFEELIDYKFGMQFDKSEKEEIKELLQEVCEAKIAECFRIANEKDSSIADEISDLPTDRIKTEK